MEFTYNGWMKYTPNWNGVKDYTEKIESIEDFLEEDIFSIINREFYQTHGSKEICNFLYKETFLKKLIKGFKKIIKWQL